MKIMRLSLSFVALLAFSSFFTSCDKVKDLITFNVPLQTADVSFTIAPQPAGTQILTAFQFGINVDSVLKKENSSLGVGNIKKVKVKSVSITVTNPTSTDHFGVLSACEVGLASNAIPTYTTFAALTSNPDAYATTLTIPANDVDLKDYFGSTVLYYRLSGTTRRATTTTLQCKATIQFDIEAGL